MSGEQAPEPRRYARLATPLFFALLAAALLAGRLFTVGLGVGYDSVNFHTLSRAIEVGSDYWGFAMNGNLNRTIPPLYPYWLGTWAKFTPLDVMTLAKVSNVLFYSAATFVGCLWLGQLVRTKTALYAGSLAIVFSPAMVISFDLMTDTALYFLLVLTLFLARHLHRGAVLTIVAVAALCSVCAVTRWLGVAVAASNVAFLYLCQRRWYDIHWPMVFAVLSLASFGAWTLRSYIIADNPLIHTQRALDGDYSSASILVDVAHYALAVADWVLPVWRAELPPLEQASSALDVVAGIAVLAAGGLVIRYWGSIKNFCRTHPDQAVLLAFIAVYSAMVIVADYLGTAHDSLVTRRADPIFIPVILLAVPLLEKWCRGRKRMAWALTGILCAAFFVNTAMALPDEFLHRPLVHVERELVASETVAQVRHLSDKGFVYSNSLSHIRWYEARHDGPVRRLDDVRLAKVQYEIKRRDGFYLVLWSEEACEWCKYHEVEEQAVRDLMHLEHEDRFVSIYWVRDGNERR